MYRVEPDFGNPVWLLVTIPTQYGSSVEGELRRNEVRATWYAMNATEIYVIRVAKTVGCHALAKITARLCHQSLAWTGRTRYPVHLHAAEQMDLDHRQYRRSALGEDPEADSTGEPRIEDSPKEEE